MMTTIQQLAAKPAGDDQIARAREIAATCPSLRNRLEIFLTSEPTRGEMNDFLAQLRGASSVDSEDQAKQKIEAICRIAGIENPSGANRLMAMQIGLLQEQNALLQSGIAKALGQARANANAKQNPNSNDFFTGFIGSTVVAALLIS